jgi:bifunctional DNA-binding transcriptional regulator/antitoxin component of YhaV-PrlF toxin-antitoxin module
MNVKLIRIGNSRGIIIPNHILKKLGLVEGDLLTISSRLDPPEISLATPEAEMAHLGIDSDERRVIQQFLETCNHILDSL